jgi:hypothetical protein
MAMDLLQAGVDRSVIALWLGHESVETTQIYLEATLAMKERALAKTLLPHGRPGRYQPGDQPLGFLNSVGPGRWPGQNWKGTQSHNLLFLLNVTGSSLEVCRAEKNGENYVGGWIDSICGATCNC